MYRIFESTVSSDIPLTGLLQVDAAEGAGLSVQRGDGRLSTEEVRWQHVWHEPDGTAVLISAVVGEDDTGFKHLLRFPELADFHIAETAVTYFPEPGCSEDTLSHLLVDQVLPRVWAHQGHCVLHGSSVAFPDGGVGVFLGESGMGKSTLATALVNEGCTLLGDDCVSLVDASSGIRVVPSYCGLRLYEDAIAVTAQLENVSGLVSQCSTKRRLDIGIMAEADSWSLQRLYVLDVPSSKDTIEAIPLDGAELLSALIKASFLLDVRDSARGARQMQALGSLANSLPLASRLLYPRDFRLLPSVVAFLVD